MADHYAVDDEHALAIVRSAVANLAPPPARRDDADPAPPPGESQEVAWFTWEEADRLADGALSGALRSARRVVPTSAGPEEWEDTP